MTSTSWLTRAAMQFKASQGEYTGGRAPYGYQLADDGVHLVPVAAEQAVIAEARTMRAAGLSLRAVSEKLERCGIRSRTGRPFAASQIARMVASCNVTMCRSESVRTGDL